MNLSEMKDLPPDKQKELVNRLSQVRAAGKATNYASQYGAGAATIARTAKVSEKQGKKLHTGYWKLNWSIKKIAESTTVKKTSFGMFQKNPINGFWYSLRSDKDRVSTLIQGLGAYILDVWLLNIINLAEKRGLEVCLLGQFHDEIILEISKGYEIHYKELLNDAMDKVNKQLKLNRDLACDVQFGATYAEIH